VSESETKPAAPAGDDAAVVAGRGAIFIGFAKIFFMLSGSVQQIVLPRLIAAAQYGLMLAPADADASVRADLTAAPAGTPCSPPL